MAMQISRKICRYYFNGPFSAVCGGSFSRGAVRHYTSGRCHTSNSDKKILRDTTTRRLNPAFKALKVARTPVLWMNAIVTGYIFYGVAAKYQKVKENQRIRQEAKELKLCLKNERQEMKRLEVLLQSKRFDISS